MWGTMERKKEKDIIINPNTSGYVDRGMAKWQGLILSEHNELVQKEKKGSENVNVQKENQPTEHIYQLIHYSYSQKRPISIQMNQVINGVYEDDIRGVVYGFFQDTVYIQKESKELKKLTLPDIRHVEELSFIKWYQE